MAALNQNLTPQSPLEPVIDGARVFLMTDSLETGGSEWLSVQVPYAIDCEKRKMRASAVRATMSLISFASGLKDMGNALVR